MKLSVWGITMVVDEEDIIGYTLSHLLSQGLDGIVIADNMSKDRTRSILEGLSDRYPAGRIIIVDDNELAYHQSAKMTELGHKAAECGAEIVIPFDADELVYSTVPGKTVADLLAESKFEAVAIPMWNHYCTLSDVPGEINPYRRMPWMLKKPSTLGKAAYRYSSDYTVAAGNHQILDHGVLVPGDDIGLALRHFAWRDEDQWIRKIIRGSRAMIAAPDIPRTTCLHWREYGEALAEKGVEALKDHYRKYFTFGLNPTDKMILDPAPYTGEL